MNGHHGDGGKRSERKGCGSNRALEIVSKGAHRIGSGTGYGDARVTGIGQTLGSATGREGK